MNEFIYQCPNILSENGCELLTSNFEIISNHWIKKMYSDEERKKKKNSNWDIYFTDTNQWLFDLSNEMNKLVFEIKNVLIMNIDLYKNNLFTLENNYKLDILHKNISVDKFTVNKIEKNKENILIDKYKNNFNVTNKEKCILTYIFFLNNVDCGGNLEFFNNVQIYPEKGKIVIFPAEWFFNYKFNISETNDMYFITGNIYVDLQ
jgi:hypothetical protein